MGTAVADAESLLGLPRYATATPTARKLRVGRETTDSGFWPHSVAGTRNPTIASFARYPFLVWFPADSPNREHERYRRIWRSCRRVWICHILPPLSASVRSFPGEVDSRAPASEAARNAKKGSPQPVDRYVDSGGAASGGVGNSGGPTNDDHRLGYVLPGIASAHPCGGMADLDRAAGIFDRVRNPPSRCPHRVPLPLGGGSVSPSHRTNRPRCSRYWHRVWFPRDGCPGDHRSRHPDEAIEPSHRRGTVAAAYPRPSPRSEIYL